jgi:hypothetical protein
MPRKNTGRKPAPKSKMPGASKLQRIPRSEETDRKEARAVFEILAEKIIRDTLRKLYPPRLVGPDEKIPLALSNQERKLLANSLALMDLSSEQVRQLEASRKPVLRLTLAEWKEFSGGVAFESNHCRSARRQRDWDAFFDRVQRVLDSHRTAD